MLARVREFFAERGVLEVETPALSAAGISDPAIESITARLGGRKHYLQTSPEYAMKRLLAAGLGDSYQICRVFETASLADGTSRNSRCSNGTAQVGTKRPCWTRSNCSSSLPWAKPS